jgi:hypothetical protein
MKDRFKSLGVGISATTISMVPSLLPNVGAACTGICGSCGGGCAGLILVLGAGGLILFNRMKNRKQEKVDVQQ